MDGEQISADLARLGVKSEHLAAKVSDFGDLLDRIDRKLDAHVLAEENRLRNIEHQLSFARTLVFFGKALLVAVLAILTFKVGDISTLWKGK